MSCKITSNCYLDAAFKSFRSPDVINLRRVFNLFWNRPFPPIVNVIPDLCGATHFNGNRQPTFHGLLTTAFREVIIHEYFYAYSHILRDICRRGFTLSQPVHLLRLRITEDR